MPLFLYLYFGQVGWSVAPDKSDVTHSVPLDPGQAVFPWPARKALPTMPAPSGSYAFRGLFRACFRPALGFFVRFLCWQWFLLAFGFFLVFSGTSGFFSRLQWNRGRRRSAFGTLPFGFGTHTAFLGLAAPAFGFVRLALFPVR